MTTAFKWHVILLRLPSIFGKSTLTWTMACTCTWPLALRWLLTAVRSLTLRRTLSPTRTLSLGWPLSTAWALTLRWTLSPTRTLSLGWPLSTAWALTLRWTLAPYRTLAMGWSLSIARALTLRRTLTSTRPESWTQRRQTRTIGPERGMRPVDPALSLGVPGTGTVVIIPIVSNTERDDADADHGAIREHRNS